MYWKLFIILLSIQNLAFGSKLGDHNTEKSFRLNQINCIVIAEPALPVEKAAARELSYYLGKIIGKNIPLVLVNDYPAKVRGKACFVGEETAEKVLGQKLGPWQREEFLVRTVPQGIILAGDDVLGDPWSEKTRAGSMLAVYTFLEDYLGVHWFWPGPFGEHIPRNDRQEVPMINLRMKPKLMIRFVSIGYRSYHLSSFQQAVKKWARRSRLAWAVPAVFGHSWPTIFHFQTGEDFRAHPEWFALVQGKRQKPQMCTTNPEVIERVVQYVLSSQDQIANISPSDGFGFCECDENTKSALHKKLDIPACTSLDIPGLISSFDHKSISLSDRIFTFANEVARRVGEKNPHKNVGIFAYNLYASPPVRIKNLEPNVYISSVGYAAGHRDPAALQEWREYLRGWKRLGAKLVMREGWGAHFFLDLPFMEYNQIMASFKEAYNLGIIAAYGEGSKSFATQAPNYWAITKMMWDPERDTKNLMDEYFKQAYGPVAAEMKAYFATYDKALDENWAKRRRVVNTARFVYANLLNSWNVLLPRKVVEHADKRLRKAEEKVPPGEYADRLAFHRFGQDYTAVMLELLDTYHLLAEAGIPVALFPVGKESITQSERQRLLQKAYDLGERREQMLLQHCDWAAMDEGLYAYTNDANVRQSHAAVKRELGVSSPSQVSKEKLMH